MLRNLLRSASLRAALALGFGGLAFTLGNLIFARELPAAEYGLLSLVLGILSVGMLAAPLGLDLVVARRGLQLGLGLRRSVLIASASTGIITAAIAAEVYEVSRVVLVAIAVTTAASGAIQAGVAHFQGQRRFGIAAWLLQIPNISLVPIALITLLLGLITAQTVSVLIAFASLIGLAGTWYLVTAHQTPLQELAAVKPMWREALPLLGITMASAVFMQLERLMLVPAVGVRGLALFGVVAALVGSPFRMIQAAVLFTLIPGMRAAHDVNERRRLLGREVVIVTAAVLGGSLVIGLLAPPLAQWFLAGRYNIGEALLAAAIVSGWLKVCSAFATSVAVALGDERDLRHVSLTAWVSIGIAVAGGFLAAAWGLTGVLYGISAGWLVRTLAAAWIATPHLLHGRGDLPYPIR